MHSASKKVKSWKWNAIFFFILLWFLLMIVGWFSFYSKMTVPQQEEEKPKEVATRIVNAIENEKDKDNEFPKDHEIPIEKDESHRDHIDNKLNADQDKEREKEKDIDHVANLIERNLPLEESKEKDIPAVAVALEPQVQAPKIAPITKPKTGDMWKMRVHDQREYLQSLHAHEVEPSLLSAQEFIEYAKQSINREIPSDDPVNAIWPYPSSTYDSTAGYGSPGQQRIPYHIAGKDVFLPYGYPEETIFILTASYRDPEVASTIARAYARAAHPDRIFVGIHAQNEGGDLEPERDPIGGLKHTGLTCPSHPVCSRLNNIRVSRAHYSKSEGPTVARAIAERHYRNETYVLGIDSHCHFLRGWDNVGIDMFKRLKNDMALITAYPASYSEGLQGGYGGETYDVNPLPAVQQTICRTRRVNVHTSVSFKHDMNSMKRPVNHNQPIRVAFFAAGFSFSRGHRIQNVPYDYYTPYIFDGEETSMGVRAWTWGYDLYQNDRDIISHFYIQSQSKFRPVFWTSPEWNIQWPTQFGSLIRIQKQLHIYNQLLGTAPAYMNPYQDETKLLLNEIGVGERYGVGPYRDVEEYWKWAEIDLQNKWGVDCENPRNRNEKGREFCYSKNLCEMYFDKGGMPLVPLKKEIPGGAGH